MLGNRADLVKLRSTYEASLKAETKKILICAGTGCISSGSLEIYDRLTQLLKDEHIP